jgi:MerR family mercuric resistance operon transcriptional regulator
MSQTRFSIGELARATGVGVETIRYYERIGLLTRPERTAGNYRSYSLSAERRLQFVRRARGMGFTVEQVRSLLTLADRSAQECGEVDAMARVHLEAIDQKITALEALRGELQDLVDHCNRSTIADCRIIRSLQGAERPA